MLDSLKTAQIFHFSYTVRRELEQRHRLLQFRMMLGLTLTAVNLGPGGHSLAAAQLQKLNQVKWSKLRS